AREQRARAHRHRGPGLSMIGRSPRGSPGVAQPRRGFTLLEALVVVALLAILAAIALPSYSAYVKRSRILEAVARLSDARARMEQYFFDQRAYVDAGGGCGALPPPSNPADAFALA